MLRSDRSDKNYVALPKYSTRRELGLAMGWPNDHDDRALLTLVLDAGEQSLPVPLHPNGRSRGLAVDRFPDPSRAGARTLAADVDADLRRIQVLHYRPHAWLPALRVESSTGSRPTRIAWRRSSRA